MKKMNTERLVLRKLVHTDAIDIFEYCQFEDIVDMVGMRHHNSIEFTQKYINHELKKSETLAIVLKEKDKLIGTISLRKMQNDSNLDIRLLSTVINPSYWGNGYAPEAIKEVVKFAFEIEKVHKILGGHYSFNNQSASVNKKLRFVYEGRQREVYIYKGKLVDAIEYSLLFKDYEEASKKW